VPNPDPAPRSLGAAGRLFSLTGVVSLGAFLLVHIALNARALRGDAAFARSVRALDRVPALTLIEWIFVWAPLLLHTSIGLWLIVTRKSFAEPSPYPKPLRAAMRVTGVAVIAFLALHLPELRFRTPGARPDGGELSTILAADLSSTWHGVPWRGAAYLVGAACVAFHFAAGMWGFFVRMRGQARARERTWVAWGAGAIGTTAWALLANIVVFHATGARMFGGPEEPWEPRVVEPCPEGDGGVR
jgi:succinate dehydrogenase / fumarate reductase cytochrome b subunit